MKRIVITFGLLVLAWGGVSHGLLSEQVESMTMYVRLGKTIVIGKCVASDDEPIHRNVISYKVRVVETLQGDLKKGQEVHVLTGLPGDGMRPGHLYLIYSGNVPDSKGELKAFSYEPAVVPISLSEDQSQTVDQWQVAQFLRQLEPLTLEQKLLRIIKRRHSEVKTRILLLDEERKALEGLLLKDPATEAKQIEAEEPES